MFWRRPVARAAGCELDCCLLTDIGCRRERNEDSGMVIRPADSQVLARRGILMVIADGMGGHSGGEVASQLAVETIGRAYYANQLEPAAALVAGFQQANRAIYKLSRERPDLDGMGTTCTALALTENLAWVAYAGDTRLYLVRAGEIYRMVEDHSAVMELVKLGVLSLEEAQHHEDRNVILRALGTRDEIEVSTWNAPLPVQAGDYFVLCSDGLYDLVSDQEIRGMALNGNPQSACTRLISVARQRGGHDNITVGIALVKPRRAATSEGMRETRAVEVPQ